MLNSTHFFPASGVRLSSICTERFKRDSIAINIMLPLNEETAAENALLIGVLTHSSKEYPNMYSLNRKLDAMYGARLSSNIFKIGEIQVVRMGITVLRSRYTPEKEDFSIDGLKLLLSLLTKPCVNNCEFDSNVIDAERQNLADMIMSSINDKGKYANERLVSIMCSNENYGVREVGTLERLNTVTPKSLYEAWEKIIRTANVEIVAVGEANAKELSAVISKSFASISREVANYPETDTSYSMGEVRTVTEMMDVEQAKLAIGFRTGANTRNGHDNYALLLANAIFGSGTNSKLFLNVREKMNLCYYCSSRLDNFKGVMLVQSGIDAENYELTLKEIYRQIDDIKRGNFTDDDLSAARLFLQTLYHSVEDDLSTIEGWYLRRLIANKVISPAESSCIIENYTRADVIAAFHNIIPDTIYFLKGKD